MKRKRLRLMLLCAVLLLCAALCAGCGKDAQAPDLGQYFSKEEIDSWKKAGKEKERKYTMYGGYFLCFQGEYYPIEFNDGAITWRVTPPDELLFVTMNELFTDASLKNRCAYLGLTEHAVLFQSDCQHSGYLLDGKRPAYGSVLYVDEADLRNFGLVYGSSGTFAPDQQIEAKRNNGEPISVQLAVGRILLTDKSGVFLEEFSTFRKILTYARVYGIPFDAYTEYTGLSYPSSLVQIWDDHFWESPDAGCGGNMKPYPVEFNPYYCVCISYANTAYADLHCLVFTSDNAKEETYEQVRFDHQYPSTWANFKDPVWNAEGELTSCYIHDFYSSNHGETATMFFGSVAEFQNFLLQQRMVDYDAQTAISYFTAGGSGEPFDGFFDFQNLYSALYLNAVWDPYHVVNLYGGETTMEAIVRNDDGLLLQPAMRPGYEFEGWYADANFTGQSITKLHYNDTYENLYAKFRQVDYYTLSFQEYEGKTVENIQYTYGETFQLPKLTKSFYIFNGWCLDAECKTQPITEISTEFYGSYHFYPCFEARTYTITLHYGEKTKDIQVAYGAQFAMTLGVTDGFIGYFDENGVQYTDENGNSLAPFTDGADIQLFARYKEE